MAVEGYWGLWGSTNAFGEILMAVGRRWVQAALIV